MHPQLALAIGLPDHSLFETFHAGPNAAAVDRLRAVAERSAEPVLWLWGAAGTGKTHLLQAACAAAARRERQSVYLPLGQLRELGADVLAGWHTCDLVCVDDVDRLTLSREAPDGAIEVERDHIVTEDGLVAVFGDGRPNTWARPRKPAMVVV